MTREMFKYINPALVARETLNVIKCVLTEHSKKRRDYTVPTLRTGVPDL